MSAWPFCAAACSGVNSPCCRALTSAPCSSNCRAISKWPPATAECSGWTRMALSAIWRGFAPWSRSQAATSGCPKNAARPSGGKPSLESAFNNCGLSLSAC